MLIRRLAAAVTVTVAVVSAFAAPSAMADGATDGVRIGKPTGKGPTSGTITGALVDGAEDGTITSTVGPLTLIATSPDLTCAVHHRLDSHGEFYADTACGTFAAVDGEVYGPFIGNHWDAEGQSSGGAGTAANPYRIVTTVTGGPLRVVQTDTYVVGVESYGTRVQITNTTSSPKLVTLYRAADCYLQDSDFGYGRVSGDAVACVAGQDAASRVEQWAPLTAGSHYLESWYASVWEAVSSQLPFPDTCDCDIHQDNGAGLSWTVTIPAGGTSTFSHLTAFSPTGGTQVQDSDGDGFPDSWEQPSGGVDTNGDGTPDLKLSDFGATPDKKDVFLQVGWTKRRGCTLYVFSCHEASNFKPNQSALEDIQSVFKTHGIRLHIDAGPQSLMNPDTGARWGNLSRAGDGVQISSDRISGWSGSCGEGSFNWNGQFSDIKENLFPAARSRIFHFVLATGAFQPDSCGASGIARARPDLGVGGGDLIFAAGVSIFDLTGGPNRIATAGTIMHELGHDLGLSHGGSPQEAHDNYKANYPSVMNYHWQIVGLNKNGRAGVLDYSEGTLSPLDEAHLSERAGLEPDAAASIFKTRWICPNRDAGHLVPAVSNLDFNCDGQIQTPTYAADITKGDGGEITVLHDYDDWANLQFDGGGTLGGAGDSGSAVDVTAPQEDSAETIASVTGTVPTVNVQAPGTLTMQAATQAPVDVTITNNRDSDRTYNLSSIASGVSVSDLPATVTLTAGQTKTITVTLAAGAADPGASAEIDATAADDDATDADSAIMNVAIVDQVVPDQPSASNPGGGGSGGGSSSPSTTSSSPSQGTATAPPLAPATPTPPTADQATRNGGLVAANTTRRAVKITVDGTTSRLNARTITTVSSLHPGSHTITVSGAGQHASVTATVASGQLVAVAVMIRDGRPAVKATVIASGQARVLSMIGGVHPVTIAGKTRRLREGATAAVSAGQKIAVGARTVTAPSAAQLIAITFSNGRLRAITRSL